MPGSLPLFSDLLITLSRVLVWTCFSWLAGMFIGFICYRSRILNLIVLPVVNFLRHISPFCWLPLIIIAAGIGELAVGITLFISLSFHAVIVTIELLRSLPRTVMEQAVLDGAQGWKMFLHIELPISLPGILDIFRVLWGVGWSAIIAAEMLGVRSGMGYRLLDFRYLLRYREMLLYIAVIGAVGVVTDLLLQALKAWVERCVASQGKISA